MGHKQELCVPTEPDTRGNTKGGAGGSTLPASEGTMVFKQNKEAWHPSFKPGGVSATSPSSAHHGDRYRGHQKEADSQKSGGNIGANRRFFDKLMNDPEASLYSESHAVRFVEVLSTAEVGDRRRAIWQLVDRKKCGRQRIQEVVAMASSSGQGLNAATLPLLGFLVGKKHGSDLTLKDNIDLLCSVIHEVPSLVVRMKKHIPSGRLSEVELETIARFLVNVAVCDQDARKDEEMVVLLSMLLEYGSDNAEVRRLQVAMGYEEDGEERLPLHDNDLPCYRDISIIPTLKEVACAEHPYLPSHWAPELDPDDDDDDQAAAEGALLDAHFRLLREDIMGPLREELHTMQSGGKRRGKKGQATFIDVQVTRVDFKGPGCVVISFETRSEYLDRVEPKQRVEYWDRSRLLGKDSLVCLLRDGKPWCFGTVAWRDAHAMAGVKSEEDGDGSKQSKGKREDHGKRSPVRSELGIALDRDIISLLVPNISLHLDGVTLVQACPSFFAYEPILRCLQDMTSVPFAEQLVMLRPGEQLATPAIPRHLRTHVARLDEAQMDALNLTLSRPVSLVQGPPGTGKTHLGLLACRILLATDRNCKLMCLTYTNHALDQFLEALFDAGETSMVRIGGRSQSERLVPYNLTELSKDIKSFDRSQKAHYRSLKEHMKSLKRKIEEAESFLASNCLTYRLVYDHLETGRPEGFDAFRVSFNTASGEDWTMVGANGARVDAQYLWDRWKAGKDPGPVKELKRRSLWMRNRAQRQIEMEAWLQGMRKDKIRELEELLKEYREVDRSLQRMNMTRKLEVLREQRVIGVTTTGAAKWKDMLDTVPITVVLVEEAAEILEAHVLCSLGASCRQLIMIGDHLQLRPKVENYELQVESGKGYDLNRSLFERLVSSGFQYKSLATQHRMRPQISAIVKQLMYPHLRDAESVMTYPRVKGLQENLVFLHHNELERQAKGDVVESMSKINDHEVEMVTNIIKYLLRQGYLPKDLVVLTPYLGQLLEIRKALALHDVQALINDLDVRDLRKAGYEGKTNDVVPSGHPLVRVATVDNFQGEESDVVVISLVRSNQRGDVGWLKEKQRVNVMLSRARHGMIVVGNAICFRNSKGIGGSRTLWAELLNDLEEQGCLFEGLPTICEQHREEGMVLVRRPEDFEKLVPQGGCARHCQAKLSCGHGCPSRFCHPSTTDHGVCVEPVFDYCPKRHVKRRLCHQSPAGKCKECEVIKQLEAKEERLRQILAAQQAEKEACRKKEEKLLELEKLLKQVETEATSAPADDQEVQARYRQILDTIQRSLDISDVEDDLPESWTNRDPEKVVLVPVSKKSEEWGRVEARFTRNFACQVIRVERVEAPRLYRKYLSQRKHVVEENDDTPNLLILVHGTRKTSPAKVIHSSQGLSPQYCDKGMFGRAVYMAEDMAYSHEYRHTLSDGTFQVFLVELEAGRVMDLGANQDRSLREPPPGFHTVKGQVAPNHQAYMVYEHHHQYPTHLVSYRM